LKGYIGFVPYEKGEIKTIRNVEIQKFTPYQARKDEKEARKKAKLNIYDEAQNDNNSDRSSNSGVKPAGAGDVPMAYPPPKLPPPSGPPARPAMNEAYPHMPAQPQPMYQFGGPPAYPQ
jgi:hypothetical protein